MPVWSSGLIYQRMVTAEQRLKSDHYAFQERWVISKWEPLGCYVPCLTANVCLLSRVFVLADPDIFSGSLGQMIVGDIESSASSSGGFQSPLDHMCNVIQHTMQAALGTEQCHGPKLAQALKVSQLYYITRFVVLLSRFSSTVVFGGHR